MIMDNIIIPRGRYKHFKTGTEYIVLGEVKDTDTEEIKVLYHSIYGDFYSRSITSWLEWVEDNQGRIVQRFTRIGE